MPLFQDAHDLYEVLDALFCRLRDDEGIARALLADGLVVRFRYRDPEGSVTIDLRQAPMSWVFGDCDVEPDVEMIQSADTAHTFWLGRLSVPKAIATRQVVTRGSVTKALGLLPALEPAFAVYAEVLRELGREELLPTSASESSVGRVRRRVRELLTRTERALPIAWRTAQGEGNAIERPPMDALTPAPETAPASAPASAAELLAGPALHREMLARMLLIRAFEEKLSEANARGEIPTEAIHLSIGQEACAVGACFALRTDDYVASTHRGHGHMLAKGADLDGMMAELLGRAAGLCGGKGGSMHVTDSRVGAIGANGIVGASPLIAAGAAHSARLRGTDQVAVAFLGDGATNQGMFHEALNFAAVFDLPALFVVENNLYGEFTPIRRHTRVERLADRANAYGFEGVTVDGNDVRAVHEATLAAVERARSGEGPVLLELLTYRWHGHMEGEDVPYRPVDEVEAWKARCPIAAFRTRLVADGELTEDEARSLEEQARDLVERSYARALASPEPSLNELATDVYAPEDPVLYESWLRPSVETREITCSRALWEALHEELERDPSAYLLGEDVTTGGYFSVTAGLADDLGTERVVDTPISEYAIVGSAVGAAMTGCRPVAEILFSDFLTTCMDPLVNQAAKLRYMSGGQYRMPLVVRTPGGAGLGMAAQHSQSLEAILTGIPGLIVVAPGTPADAKGLLKSAIRSNNPVVFFENKLLYAVTGPVPVGEHLVPLGVADIKRPGRDVTVVSVGASLDKALRAADALAAEGVSVEVVDVRTLVPLDLPTILESVGRTGRLVTVEDAPLTHGFGAEIVARVVEGAFGALVAPPARVAARDVPLPYNSKLENAALPDADAIVEACRSTLRHGLAWKLLGDTRRVARA